MKVHHTIVNIRLGKGCGTHPHMFSHTEFGAGIANKIDSRITPLLLRCCCNKRAP